MSELETAPGTEGAVQNGKQQGSFMDSLTRNNKQIKGDRAQAIEEQAEMTYRRHLEDLYYELRGKKRDQENMLDMSPTNTQSLIVASDFKAKEFVNKSMQLLVDIRDLQIKLDLGKTEFEKLFGTSISFT